MITLLIFLAVLSVLVFVHEFGHFITAKRSGARVEEFGFGFPPRLFGWKRGETVYSLNWIPIGGFVKITGEGGENPDDPKSFASKSALRRAWIVAAGVVMNALLAVVLLSFGFMVGMPSLADNLPPSARVRDLSIVVTDVLPDTPAVRAGLQAGDDITEVSGERLASVSVFLDAIARSADHPLRLTVTRDGIAREVVVTPENLRETNRPGLGIGLVATATVSYSWYEAPVRGAIAAGSIALDVLRAFGGLVAGLFRGHVAADFSGPVGIAVITGEVARLGLTSLIQFVALLSVNLAIVNLIPFPALDGGRLLFIGIEAVRRRPVPKKWEERAHRIGFSLLIMLVALVTLRDLSRFRDILLAPFRGYFGS